MPQVRQSTKDRRLIARGGVPRKKGKRARAKISGESDGQDPNAEIIVPQGKEEKMRQREERLRLEVRRLSLLVSCKFVSYTVVPVREPVKLENEQQEEETTGQVYRACAEVCWVV
jgi:hypothetical protein